MVKKESIKKLAKKLNNLELKRDLYIMEVCGTHTMEFFRTGVKDIFPKKLHLIDGPGCPVCVTPNTYLDRIIEIGKKYKNIVITTFGDMIRVPSSYSSLREEKAKGMNIEIVYSPFDALEIAKKNPDKEVIFLGIGFETTAPGEAATIIRAKEENIKNFSLLSGAKLTIPAVCALLEGKDAKIDGFIYPGHVSVVTGMKPYHMIAKKYGKPGVVTGFEAHDLIIGTLSLITLIKGKKQIAINEYKRVVREEGNLTARTIMYKVFEKGPSTWRGLGEIPDSGLFIRETYRDFDALYKFPVNPPPPKEHPGCRCGEILKGQIIPYECPLFGKTCTPETPVGPCMVSSEGACAAYYKYGREKW